MVGRRTAGRTLCELTISLRGRLGVGWGGGGGLSVAGTGGESFIPLKVFFLTLPLSSASCGICPFPLLGAWLFHSPSIAPWCGGGGGQRSLFALISLILIHYCTRLHYTTFVCHNKYLISLLLYLRSWPSSVTELTHNHVHTSCVHERTHTRTSARTCTHDYVPGPPTRVCVRACVCVCAVHAQTHHERESSLL